MDKTMERYFINGELDFNAIRNDLVYMHWALCDVEEPDAYIDGLCDMVSDLIAEIDKAI